MAENLIMDKENPIRDEQDIAIKISGLKKRYKLGLITAGTLKGDIQSWWARKRGKEDPNLKIGAKVHGKNEVFMALDGIDLTIYKGERIGIIGHNGAGKSTLLKLLARVTGPTEGEIKIDGRITSMLEVGTGFNGELTGRENIYLNGAILGMTKAEVDSKMEQIIDFSECRQFIDTPVKRYSSGMFVKLAFAVAAHLDSEIMIMDEVLAVGDMAFQKKCLEKMSDVSKTEGRTILYVSHNMNTIRQLCDRCIVLNHGKIIFNGDVEEAIDIYIKNNQDDNENVNIDYTDIPRLKWLRNTKIKTLYSEFVDKSDICFRNEEKPHILIKWINEEDVNNLNLRVEILNRDRTPIGTAFLYDFYKGKKNEIGQVEVVLDLPYLVDGKYATNYVFFYENQFGQHIGVDGVHGLNFEIRRGDNNKTIWDRRSWGNIKFPDLTISKG